MAAHPSRPIGLCRPSAQVSTQPGALQIDGSRLSPASPAGYEPAPEAGPHCEVEERRRPCSRSPDRVDEPGVRVRGGYGCDPAACIFRRTDSTFENRDLDLVAPAARAEVVRDTYFGVTVEDPYRWLEAMGGEEVRALLGA